MNEKIKHRGMDIFKLNFHENNMLPALMRRNLYLFYIFMFIGFHAIVQYPIFHSALPMLSDYPNHLARMHILLKAGESSELNKFYEIHWALLPNLAMDGIVPMLAQIVGIEIAGKLFLGSILLLISSGTIVAHFTIHRRLSPWPFVVFVFLYNAIFLYGVINFLFGIGMALWVFAAWLRVRNAPISWLLPSFAIAATTLLFCHLSAFGFFALMTMSYEIACVRPLKKNSNWKSLLALGIVLAIPLIIFSIFSPSVGLQKFNYTWLSIVNHTKMVIAKPLLIRVFFSNYNNKLDLATLAFFGILLIRGIFSGALTISPEMKVPLAVAGMVVLLMPSELFGSSLADSRLVVAIGFIFISSVDIKPAIRLHYHILAASALVMILLFRTNVIVENWDEADTVTASAVDALEKIGTGKRLLVAFDEHKGENSFLENFEKFLPCLGVISRSAFVPSLYTLPGAQPVQLTPKLRLAQMKLPLPAIPNESTAWALALKDYDYVWISRDIRFAGDRSASLSMVVRNTRFQLYRVNRD